MAKQLHKKFTDSQVKELIERYLKKEIERKYIQEILGIKKRRLFELVKSYRENPDKTTPAYLIVKSIQDMDQYSISNPLYSVPGVRFADLFQVVEYYWNEEKEKG